MFLQKKELATILAAHMSYNHCRSKMIGNGLSGGISMITNVVGVDTPWVVIATANNIPRSVTGASLAILSVNLAVFDWGSFEFSFR